MFRYANFRENRRHVVSLDCDLHAFVFVLKLLYGCGVSSDAWKLKSLEEVIVMMTIINRFLITSDVEQVVTEQFISRLGLFDTVATDPEYKEKTSHNFSLLLEAYQLAKRYHFECLTRRCLDYFDAHSSQLVSFFEKKMKYSPELIHQIIERDSFGVPEIKIFNLVKKMIQKIGLEATKPLVRAIRFSQLSRSELSEVYASNILKGANGVVTLNFMKQSINSCARICHEKERVFSTSDISCQKATLSRCLSVRLMKDLSVSEGELDSIHKTTIRLTIPTVINHIVLNLGHKSKGTTRVGTIYSKLAYFFRIVLIGHDGKKTELKYFLIPHFDILTEYFFAAKPVDHIQIYCDRDIVIHSLSYGLTENVIDSKFLCEIHEYDRTHRCVWNS